MKAEILAVGTELLLGDILNTNAQFLAQELANLGIEVYYQTVVGDNPQRLKDTIFHAFSRADLIITTGGLGPTEDDLTKETAAEYFGERLILDERALGRIRKYFDRTGRVMTENNVKQAMVPEKNGIVLYNDNGTAPGIIMEKNGKMIVMLPGPPRETIPMFQNQVKPYLAKKQEFTFVSRILRVAEVGESAMEERVKDIIDAQTNPTIAPYAKDGEAILRITAKARDEEEANRLIDPVAAVLKERLGDAVYGEGETDLETVVAEQLLQKQLTLAVAESCTGGMIASNLVEYPGISAALVEGCVTYSNEAKMHRLGVRRKHWRNTAQSARKRRRKWRRALREQAAQTSAWQLRALQVRKAARASRSVWFILRLLIKEKRRCTPAILSGSGTKSENVRHILR